MQNRRLKLKHPSWNQNESCTSFLEIMLFVTQRDSTFLFNDFSFELSLASISSRFVFVNHFTLPFYFRSMLLNNCISFSVTIWVFDFLLKELSSFTFTTIIFACMYLVAWCRNSSWISLSKMEIHGFLQAKRTRVQLETRWARDSRLLCLTLLLSDYVVHTHTTPHIFPALSTKRENLFCASPVEQTLKEKYDVHSLCQFVCWIRLQGWVVSGWEWEGYSRDGGIGCFSQKKCRGAGQKRR